MHRNATDIIGHGRARDSTFISDLEDQHFDCKKQNSLAATTISPSAAKQQNSIIANMLFSSSNVLSTLMLFTTAFASPMSPAEYPAPSNSTSLSPRDQNINENADMTIQFFSAPNCEGAGSLWPTIVYNDQVFGFSTSFRISRDLIDKEVLDFSTGPGVPPQTFTMSEAVRSKGGQYPGPGYITGGFNVPSPCDAFLWTAPPMAPAKLPSGSKRCYTVPRPFNCARLWMQS